ncbi:hypothetical protein [Enterococcus mediterraneensis]|uniref:hypothetical protein n=1 Tax=Enterococcus mediterraneensis TaxID=2364791 RepID=UPI000F04E9DB|nr:hypothetical protein [Enterococcus mediterraneensis]
MKKKTMFTGILSLVLLFLVSCTPKETPPPDDSSVSREEQIQKPKLELESDEMIIMQVDNHGFPQSQGVYDVHENALTIVKQYIPDDDETINSEKMSDLFQEKIDMIQKDFDENFAGQELSDDLFKVYERKVPNINVSLDGQELILKGKDFKKIFNFVVGSTVRVLDANNVEYKIKFDNEE